MEYLGLEVRVLRRDRRGVDVGTSVAPFDAFDASSTTTCYVRCTFLAYLASRLACLATPLLFALRTMKYQPLPIDARLAHTSVSTIA